MFTQQAAVAIENARLYEQVRGKAALEERQRLARDLHDSVSQALYGILLNASTADELFEAAPGQAHGPGARRAWTGGRRSGGAACADVRVAAGVAGAGGTGGRFGEAGRGRAGPPRAPGPNANRRGARPAPRGQGGALPSR